MATRTKSTATTKPAAVEDVEDDEDEVEEVEAPETKANEVTFGVADLAKYLSKGRDKAVTTRELRTLIRKMARDGKGRVNREIIPGNRTRYNWSGLKDPEVRAIIKAFNDGELEADKQEKLAALKERKAAQTAEKKAAAEKAEKATARKAKAAVVVEEDDEDLDLEDDE